MSLAPTTIGRYRIVGLLGSGGMATVYKAIQPALERTVALKVIRRGFAEDPEFRERFGREAKAIAHLTHPNIVQVHDFDEVDGQVFLAMQYLPGGTLKERLARLAAEGGRSTTGGSGPSGRPVSSVRARRLSPSADTRWRWSSWKAGRSRTARSSSQSSTAGWRRRRERAHHRRTKMRLARARTARDDELPAVRTLGE